MKQAELDELERILAGEEELQPTTGFSARVMRAVREEAAATAPMPFPWARFLPGFLINLVMLGAAAVWIVLQPGSSSLAQPISAEWLSDPEVQGLLWAALTVAGAGALAWTASRWAGTRRLPSF